MAPSRPAQPATAARPLPLESGDHLTRAEFERRYEALPELKKAELVEGVVYVGSPVSTFHSEPHAALVTWLGLYAARTPGVRTADNGTVRLDLDNEPQPDVHLRFEKGGQTHVSEDGYVEGAPELVAEVAASSASYDLHPKKRAYRRNAVQEYVVWRVLDDALDWFVLEDGAYVPLAPSMDGTLRSRVFPGLWLDPPALLGRDLARVLDVLQEGLKSPEHAAFVAQLASRGAT